MIIGTGISFFRPTIGGSSSDGRFKFNITAPTDTIQIKCKNLGVYDGTIHYGNGVSAAFVTYNDAAFDYVYPEGAGSYEILIEGSIPAFQQALSSTANIITSIEQWGLNAYVYSNYCYTDLTNLVAINAPIPLICRGILMLLICFTIHA